MGYKFLKGVSKRKGLETKGLQKSQEAGFEDSSEIYSDDSDNFSDGNSFDSDSSFDYDSLSESDQDENDEEYKDESNDKSDEIRSTMPIITVLCEKLLQQYKEKSTMRKSFQKKALILFGFFLVGSMIIIKMDTNYPILSGNSPTNEYMDEWEKDEQICDYESSLHKQANNAPKIVPDNDWSCVPCEEIEIQCVPCEEIEIQSNNGRPDHHPLYNNDILKDSLPVTETYEKIFIEKNAPKNNEQNYELNQQSDKKNQYSQPKINNVTEEAPSSFTGEQDEKLLKNNTEDLQNMCCNVLDPFGVFSSIGQFVGDTFRLTTAIHLFIVKVFIDLFSFAIYPLLDVLRLITHGIYSLLMGYDGFVVAMQWINPYHLPFDSNSTLPSYSKFCLIQAFCEDLFARCILGIYNVASIPIYIVCDLIFNNDMKFTQDLVSDIKDFLSKYGNNMNYCLK